MTDYTALKRLAEAALRNWPDSKLFERPECERFIDAARPDVVLALIAEVDGLHAQHGRDSGELRKLCAARDSARRERDKLRAEIAGLRTGYEAYERVNAELKAEVEALHESNDKLTRRNGMLEQNVEVMTEAHVLYTWLRKKCDQPSNDVVAVHMNIGHDWATVHDLDTDLRAMIEREEP